MRPKTLGGNGPNMCIDLHRACRHVKCVRVRARGSRALLFSCLLFFFSVMLHARGNLDLESPEELLTSSWHSGPLRSFQSIAFGRLIFTSFSVMLCCIICSCIFGGFRPPFWRQFPYSLHYFIGHRFSVHLQYSWQGFLYTI